MLLKPPIADVSSYGRGYGREAREEEEALWRLHGEFGRPCLFFCLRFGEAGVEGERERERGG